MVVAVTVTKDDGTSVVVSTAVEVETGREEELKLLLEEEETTTVEANETVVVDTGTEEVLELLLEEELMVEGNETVDVAVLVLFTLR